MRVRGSRVEGAGAGAEAVANILPVSPSDQATGYEPLNQTRGYEPLDHSTKQLLRSELVVRM